MIYLAGRSPRQSRRAGSTRSWQALEYKALQTTNARRRISGCTNVTNGAPSEGTAIRFATPSRSRPRANQAGHLRVPTFIRYALFRERDRCAHFRCCAKRRPLVFGSSDLEVDLGVKVRQKNGFSTFARKLCSSRGWPRSCLLLMASLPRSTTTIGCEMTS